MKLPSLPKKMGRRPRPTLGLDIGSHAIKLVEFTGTNSSKTIRRMGRALLPDKAIMDGSIKEPEKVAQVLRALLNNCRPRLKHASTSIAGYSVIVKKITVPYGDEQEIEDNLIFEAEKYVPFEIEEVYVDFHIVERSESEEERSAQIFLVAAKREIVDEYAALIQEVGLTPAVIDVDAFALGNAFEGAFGEISEPVALVDIGAQKTNLNVVSGGTSLFARDMAFGGYQLTETIQEATGLNFIEAERVKIAGTKDKALHKDVEAACNQLCKLWTEELKKALDFCRHNSQPDEHPTHIFLSGGTALLKGLDRLFSEGTGLPVKVFDPFRSLKADKNIDPKYCSSIAPQMALAAGLAMRTIDR